MFQALSVVSENLIGKSESVIVSGYLGVNAVKTQ